MVLAQTPVQTQAPGFPALKKSYEDEVSKTVQPLREGYRKALMTLEGQLAAKGDYAGARKVQEERLEMERLAGRETVTETAPPVSAGSGVVKLGLFGEGGGELKVDGGAWTGWESAGGFIRWTLPAGLRPGGYALEMWYASAAEGTLALTAREDFHQLNRVVKFPAAAAGTASQGRVKVGTLRVRPGASLLEIKVTAPGPAVGFRLFGVHLIPEEEAS